MFSEFEGGDDRVVVGTLETNPWPWLCTANARFRVQIRAGRGLHNKGIECGRLVKHSSILVYVSQTTLIISGKTGRYLLWYHQR